MKTLLKLTLLASTIAMSSSAFAATNSKTGARGTRV